MAELFGLARGPCGLSTVTPAAATAANMRAASMKRYKSNMH